MNGTAVGREGGRIVLEPRADRMERLAAWFHTEHAALVRFAHFVCGDAATAEDLVQEAFIRTYRSAARIDDPGFRAYARTTIVNLSRSAHRRRRAVAPRVDGSYEDPDPAVRDEVWNALQALSPRQRACMALRFYEGMRESEIASALEMSDGAVRKHTARAIARLREILGSTS